MANIGIFLVSLFLLLALAVEIQSKSHVSEICGTGQEGDGKPISPSEKKKEIEAEENEDDPLNNIFFYQGDIRLTPSQKKELDSAKQQKKKGQKRDVTANPFRKWQDPKKMLYVLDESLSEKAKTQIKAAIRDFHMYTCIRFKEKTDEKGHYIKFKKGKGCWSYVGQVANQQMGDDNSAQDISIGNGCEYKGTIIHEIMHTLGFYHEHCRLDRDNYIQVLQENLPADEDIMLQFDWNGRQKSLGLSYDYNSVMHYPLDAYSTNGLPTLKVKGDARGADIGQRIGLSADDISQVQIFYGCESLVRKSYLPRNKTASLRSAKIGKNIEKGKKTNDEEGGKCEMFALKQAKKL